MKKFFKIGCLGFIGLIVLGVIGSMLSSNDKTADTAASKPASTAQKETKEEVKLAGIGDELKVGDVVFKVNKVSTKNEIKEGQILSYKPSSDGSVFLVVNATLKNEGKQMITTDSSFFQLKKGEVTYAPTTMISVSNKIFMYDGINPGLSQTGNVVFEIPEDLNDFELSVQTGFWGTEQGQIKINY
ncbi:DUF4352 domain-containing protein [Paenibacillus amylolyticus]|uniref:DUF4352 domain-containing protein n=1 Tax=Paenibacillus amylolyticus TaxID=1451 RepID=A0A117I2S4_PAEAM|nr:DUF4352 domain-containing protein [Paenibacillus amylolyticus]GAS84168.1 unknown protein [Paenibacillus amylolyticus]